MALHVAIRVGGIEDFAGSAVGERLRRERDGTRRGEERGGGAEAARGEDGEVASPYEKHRQRARADQTDDWHAHVDRRIRIAGHQRAHDRRRERERGREAEQRWPRDGVQDDHADDATV